jgi:periplasmic divalent cation tolerance protein
MTDTKLALTTAGSQEEARKIGQTLVERRLAACVNIVPQITSIYRWEGKVEETQEWLLLIKTTLTGFSRIQQVIEELHSYDVPECVCVPIEGGSPEYITWLRNSID